MLFRTWQADVDDEADASSTPLRSRIFKIIARRGLHAKGLTRVYCGVLPTFEKRINRDPSTPLAELQIVPSNISVDAATPRCHGGAYDEDNIRLCCVGCNTVETGFPIANFLPVILSLAEATAELDSATGMLPTPTASRADWTHKDDEVVE